MAILDDHQGIIDGYNFRLNNQPDIEVVAAARFGEQLESMLAAHPADVLILDVFVPTSPDNANAYPLLFIIPSLRAKYPQMKMIIISMHGQRTLISAVLEAGASGYVLKDDSNAILELPSIVRIIANGGLYWSEQVAHLLMPQSNTETIHSLTGRQVEALSLCAAYPDASTYDLACRMNINKTSMRTLLSEVYHRLNVHSRAAAVKKALDIGLIPHAESPQEVNRLP